MLFNIMVETAKSDYIIFLFVLILFDFISGFLKAWKWKVADSWTGLKGVIKHTLTLLFYYFLAVFLAYIHAMTFGQILLIIINLYYILSIIENLAVMGVFIPNFMKARIQAELKRYTEKLEEGQDLFNYFKGVKDNEKE